MTYREILQRMEIADTERNLFKLGQWLDNQGSRAVQFPDAEPENFDSESDWEGDFPIEGWEEGE